MAGLKPFILEVMCKRIGLNSCIFEAMCKGLD